MFLYLFFFFFFFSSRRRHTRSYGDWSSDVCSSDLGLAGDDPDNQADGAQQARLRREGEMDGGFPHRTVAQLVTAHRHLAHGLPATARSRDRVLDGVVDR